MSYPDITFDAVCDFCGKSDSSGNMDQTERGWKHKECCALMDEAIAAMENWKFIGFGDRASLIKRLKRSREKGDKMSATEPKLKTKIERVIEMSFRKTRSAHFKTSEGWFIADAWFENGKPRMQIRSGADSLEDAAIVATGIQMAIDWLVEETAIGGNVPNCSTINKL